MDARPAVVLSDVKKSFPLAGGASLEVLDVGRLELPVATCTVLRGRSGAGKTTLLNLIAGVALPSSGTIRVDDIDILGLSEARRDRFRARHVGYVFQSFNLLAAFSAVENVMLAMTFADVVPRRRQRGRAAELLARFGLAERLGHRPQHLSRGEQQRVAIARAFAPEPRLLLADEPTGNLDHATGAAVMDLLFALRARHGATLMLITHDAELAARCDRQVHLADGKVA
jgi:predicted ABC-type transport system involved in lysophospholipase L1 biosynthesis ATPase subunit